MWVAPPGSMTNWRSDLARLVGFGTMACVALLAETLMQVEERLGGAAPRPASRREATP